MRKQLLTAALGFGLAVGWITETLAADTKAGKAAYEKSCAGCHGADGKGNPGMAKVIGEKGLNVVGKETMQKSDEQLLKIIAEGSGKMPASKLSKDEQKQSLNYLRSLAK
ncbi:MAG TPA: cytochrome c [Candidatus Binatia bacterium]|nr:cytochrome c [Candidatus Binatia bacterium]